MDEAPLPPDLTKRVLDDSECVVSVASNLSAASILRRSRVMTACSMGSFAAESPADIASEKYALLKFAAMMLHIRLAG